MGSCFIMMPFGGDFDAYYRRVLRQAVEASGNEPVRADEIYSSRAVIDDVCRGIAAANVCIADVSGRNPNVAYELGLAHALGKPVVLLAQDAADVPFDFQHLRVLIYDSSASDWEQQLSSRVTSTILEIQKSPDDHRALPTEIVGGLGHEAELAQDHLRRIYLASAFDYYRTNRIYFNERGDAHIKTSWEVTARSQMFLMCHHLASDKPGRIEVNRVHDMNAAVDLDWIETGSGPNWLQYFPLLRIFKEPGDEFTMSTDVFAENYTDFDSLFDNGETTIGSQALERDIRYLGRQDYLYFPRTERFSGLAAEYLIHPDEAKVGQREAVMAEGDYYRLRLVYDWGEPHQTASYAKLLLQ